ncbi:TetR/AcrR family transcriptional regulator [Gordonia sp. N1V]|uniref:TetR/AcrR family transcriptional regulator n=1 Tax=Gordonia sp. N1V TaxID=3034163 RepID=UPI0023E300A4|nr:TetR/AcrR family transcriptional regulator [Gordonia sp. N1V]MDF3281685.1 TetR family transcriptional regulator [Gordonia sp. N1V]
MTASKILRAAQQEFGDHGVDGTTIRGIARRAGVDPSLVLQHYGSKKALFALAVEPVDELDDTEVALHISVVLERRMRDLAPATRALMRSMLTSPEATGVMRDYLQERADVLAATSSADDADLRAALVVASILGITIARHFLDLPALNTTDGTLAADHLAHLLDPSRPS